MFHEFEEVQIRSSGVVGTIVDKVIRDGVARYIVEDRTWHEDDSLGGGSYPLYDCVDEDLVRLDDRQEEKGAAIA